MPSGRLPLRPNGLTPPTQMPTMIYGTAWKKDRTADLVYTALKAGFRAVDTAAQPKHYREDLVGDGIRKAIADGIVKREDLYIQTKYTPVQGQNPHDMPYERRLSITEQVKASVQSSLLNFRYFNAAGSNAYIDTLVFHTPLSTIEQTIEAWIAAETFVPEVIHNIGISNCPLPVLKALYTSPEIKIKPAVVQNRFYPDEDYDVDLRVFARENEIIYQSFWTLTANPQLVKSESVQQLAQKAGISVAVALYALVISLGKVSVLDGTTNEIHMAEDLKLSSKIEHFSEAHQQEWQDLVSGFKRLIGDPA
ncbi:aldo-keto reductase (AKR), putative [Talaromyces stipitatus ATCC 10500]|uniref:Aldo-keto reductase (AKR), putative n=1 Tax=Talaromyces stipitatus (strain ATCC 10500 / CBS 375.48 / QM 6759 / NRRL 1006) TaxID=441959 RepID=B8LXQ8_TALSN|nr:aldo-keto reductase (AKR), putative [Talaromyces stipitatus ATCC 10500]EED24559.1 aldo-keto reductase (AKR), putative [Talaromyces stipitatus ATCC 10500]